MLATATLFFFGEVVGGSIFMLVNGLSAAVSARGYEVAPGRLSILHPGRRTTLNLSDVQTADLCPGAFIGSVRLFGVGGLFGFTGLFQNDLLGRYRAFGTDPERAVVLKLADRTLVVTPDDPAAFLAAVTEAKLDLRSARALTAQPPLQP